MPAVRDQARQRFAESPFVVEKTALAFQALWRGDQFVPGDTRDVHTGRER
jgi:hypothetical protein